MTIKIQAQKLWKWLGFIWLAVFISTVVYDHAVNEPKTSPVQDQLENEFKSVEPPPNATIRNYHASHKTSQAGVSGTYNTDLVYPELKAHYDAELAKHGWIFYE